MSREAFAKLRRRLRLPLMAAPMFLVSGVELVVAACRSGIVGAFPTVNCRGSEELDRWLGIIRARLQESDAPAPWAANLVVHPSNPRLQADLAVLCRHRPELVITSVGSPRHVVEPLHDAGALVLADVASLRHAEQALAAGADGLVLLCAGAGGQTGHLSPFAFAAGARALDRDVPLALAGGLCDGRGLRAVEALGCDLACMGTRFIAATESMASEDYRRMLVDSTADDIVQTDAFTGLPANLLRPSLRRAGLDPDHLPARPAVDVSRDIDPDSPRSPFRRWRDLWSAGHSVSGVRSIGSVAEIVDELAADYGRAEAPGLRR